MTREELATRLEAFTKAEGVTDDFLQLAKDIQAEYDSQTAALKKANEDLLAARENEVKARERYVERFMQNKVDEAEETDEDDKPRSFDSLFKH